MANTRYTAVVNQIKADVGTSRQSKIDDIDRHLTWASQLWAGVHPDGWDWIKYYEEVADQNHDLAFTDLTETPRPNGIIAVSVKNTATGANDEWIPLEAIDWAEAMNLYVFNRSAGTTQDQAKYSVKRVGGTYTIETYPYTFANTTLTYGIWYVREMDAIATDADADNSFIWPSQDDMFLAHLAEISIAHELQNTDIYSRALSLVEIEKGILAQIYGVDMSVLKLPAAKDLQQVRLVAT